MAKVVILEGPDGGGKTTLATQLMGKGFEYVHEGPPAEGVDLLAHYLNILNRALKSPNNVVIDRLWLGERIYGPIFRNKDRVGQEGQRLFDRLHVSKQILHYVCLPTISVARANYIEKMKEKDDYVKSLPKWEQVFEQYARWMYNFGTMGMIYNYTQHTVETVMGDIGYMDTHKRVLPEGTYGNLEATQLFIGDRPNHQTIDVPFFALNGSSGYFNTALLQAGLSETRIAIGNAYGADGQPHDAYEMVKNLPNLRKVWLMGAKANTWFESRSSAFTHTKVVRLPHPSYLKRFKGHDPAVMALMIKEKL